MKRYFEQLIEDIEIAQNRATDAINKWVDLNSAIGSDDYFDPKPDEGIVMSKLFGLEEHYLPEESLLDDEQIRELTTSIIQLWRIYGLYPLFTPKLPKRLKYSLLRNYWSQMVFPSPGEKVNVELCDYGNCPFCVKCPVCKNTSNKKIE